MTKTDRPIPRIGPRHLRRRSPGAVLAGAAAAAALTACLLTGNAVLAPVRAREGGQLAAPAVVSSSSAAPAAANPHPPTRSPATPQRLPAAAAPVRVDYPKAGASVAVHPLTPTAADLAARAIEPPDTKDAYWLTIYGQPGAGSTDTTYIVAHRWVGADAPFNRIGEKAKPSDAFTLTTAAGALRYRVISVQDIGKADLAASPIWDRVPDRVVLITCDFNDPWGKNTVITADLTP